MNLIPNADVFRVRTIEKEEMYIIQNPLNVRLSRCGGVFIAKGLTCWTAIS